MSDAQGQARQCPTRTDGRVALFTHRVTASECQSRQRGMFHRCFSCAYNNAWVARHGLPAGEEVQDQPLAGREAAPSGGAPSDGPKDRATVPVAR